MTATERIPVPSHSCAFVCALLSRHTPFNSCSLPPSDRASVRCIQLVCSVLRQLNIFLAPPVAGAQLTLVSSNMRTEPPRGPRHDCTLVQGWAHTEVTYMTVLREGGVSTRRRRRKGHACGGRTVHGDGHQVGMHVHELGHIPADALVALHQRDGALEEDEHVAVAAHPRAGGQVVGQALAVGGGALGVGGQEGMPASGTGGTR
jgi:hypothetical protein